MTEEGNLNSPDMWDKQYSAGFYQDMQVDDKILSMNLIDDVFQNVCWILPKKILHVACGLDIIGNYIKRKYECDVISTDYSPVAIDGSMARFRGDYVLRHVMDIEYSCAYYREMDCIIALEVIEHFKTPEVPVMQMFKSLRKGGMLIFSVPYKLGKYADAEYHHSKFDKDNLTDLLMQCGFKRVMFIKHKFMFHNIAGVAFK